MSQSRSPTPIDTAITRYQSPPKSTQSTGASHESKSPGDDPPNTASTLFSPSAGFTERFMKNNSGGAYSTLNTPISRLEMGDSDEELLIQKKRRVMHYDRMDSWVELVKSGTIRFAITVMFGTLLCVCLKAWEGFKKPCALSKYDVRIFNALTIAISICLGLNLLASLKRYAVILRWSILTKRPVNMEAFDLILGIEELGNVIKLLFLSMPGLRKYRWLVGKSRQYRNMNPGTNHWYATGCALWLLINIGSQILVACLSLFWPMNPYVCPLTQYGDVAVADLSEWIYKPGEESDPRLTAWRFGMDAQSWESYPADQDVTNLSTIPGSPYYQGDDYYEYRFFYRNPKNLYSDYLQSDRSLRSSASCTSYQIDGGLRRDNRTYIRVSLDGEKWRNVVLPVWGEGGMSFIGLTKKNCGPRCARINVFQLEDDETVNKTSYWQCESTVDKIAQSGLHTLPGLNSSDERIFGTDRFARYAAGSITWSGMRMNGWEDRQFQLYPRGTPWAPDHAVSTAELEQIISRFSIGAIAAFDDHGPRHNIHINNERCDADSQRLDVGWRYILGILGGIALIQFGALCYLLAFANKTIIRDASFFSTAMLLRPVLKLVEDEPGVMTMSGEEIKDLPRLRYRKIKYDFVSKTEGGPREVTVSVWPKGNFSRESMVQWPSGEYN